MEIEKARLPRAPGAGTALKISSEGVGKDAQELMVKTGAPLTDPGKSHPNQPPPGKFRGTQSTGC